MDFSKLLGDSVDVFANAAFGPQLGQIRDARRIAELLGANNDASFDQNKEEAGVIGAGITSTANFLDSMINDARETARSIPDKAEATGRYLLGTRAFPKEVVQQVLTAASLPTLEKPSMPQSPRMSAHEAVAEYLRGGGKGVIRADGDNFSIAARPKEAKISRYHSPDWEAMTQKSSDRKQLEKQQYLKDYAAFVSSLAKGGVPPGDAAKMIAQFQAYHPYNAAAMEKMAAEEGASSQADSPVADESSLLSNLGLTGATIAALYALPQTRPLVKSLGAKVVGAGKRLLGKGDAVAKAEAALPLSEAKIITKPVGEAARRSASGVVYASGSKPPLALPAPDIIYSDAPKGTIRAIEHSAGAPVPAVIRDAVAKLKGEGAGQVVTRTPSPASKAKLFGSPKLEMQSRVEQLLASPKGPKAGKEAKYILDKYGSDIDKEIRRKLLALSK